MVAPVDSGADERIAQRLEDRRQIHAVEGAERRIHRETLPAGRALFHLASNFGGLRHQGKLRAFFNAWTSFAGVPVWGRGEQPGLGVE